MRIASIAILLTFMQSAFAADVKTSGVIYSVPDGLSLSRQLNIQTDQFRNMNGENWVITVMKFSSNLPSDQSETSGSIEKREQELKKTVDIFKRTNVVHHFERKSLNDGAALLLLGSQILRTGSGLPPNGQTYSEIDFYIFWGSGFPQLRGHIEWPGELKPNLESYINRIATIRREDQP